MVERRAAFGHGRGGTVGLHRAAKAGEASVRAGDDLSGEDDRPGFAGPAAGMLSGETTTGSKGADQRHFAGVVLFEPDDPRQRLSRDLVLVHSEKLGEVGRKRDDPQLLVGG